MAGDYPEGRGRVRIEAAGIPIEGVSIAGHESFYKLPGFRAEAHSAVRIEACETCRRYVKSIDLSADARPIPEVDDLVSLSLDLWAAEQGFTRIEPGLAGL